MKMRNVNNPYKNNQGNTRHDLLIHKFLILFKIIFLLFPVSASATTYYVAKTGNDNWAGTITNPWLTISHAETIAVAGDIVNVRTGVYNAQVVFWHHNGTANNPITFQAYPGEHPIIDGSGINVGLGSGLVMSYDNYLVFDGFEVRNSNSEGITFVGSHCIIRNCIVHEIIGTGIYGFGDYDIIEYCTVFNAAMNNADDKYNPGEIWGGAIDCRGSGSVPGLYFIIRHCIVHDIHGEGITFAYSEHAIMEDNIIYDVYSPLIYSLQNKYLLIQRNLAYMTKSMGDGSPHGIAIWDESATHKNSDITVINNIVFGCLANLALASTPNMIIENNTFVNATRTASLDVWSGTTYPGSRIENNIIIQENGLPCISVTSGSGIKFSHNLYNKSYNINAIGAGDLTGDPKLAKTGNITAGNLTAEYFKLLSSSPAINNGSVSSNVTQDFFSKPRDASPDIGAHEYYSSDQVVKVSSISVTGAGNVTSITTDNGTLQLIAGVLPDNASNKTVTWSIASGSGLAYINSATGLVAANDNGMVTARATANDGSGVFDTFEITISNQEIVNTPPKIVVNYKSSSYSGFVSEIDASESYDTDKDNLVFTWLTPDNVSVSSSAGSTIKYLAPLVSSSHTFEFTLRINDGKVTQSKVIPIEILPYKPELEAAEISSIEASSFQTPNYPYNVIDGNIGTMWSALGDNQWLLIEMKQLFNVHFIKLAFQPGKLGESYFDIFGSVDKLNWDPILIKSISCAFSSDLQVFEFPPSKAGEEFRYIKLVGRCNLIDSWNSISEFKVFGYKNRNPTSYDDHPVKLYPNPAREFVNIRIDDITLKPDFIRIVNTSGKYVFWDEMNPDIRDVKIPLDLERGLYIVQIGSGNMTLVTQKLIIGK